jgi:hypothetical protein
MSEYQWVSVVALLAWLLVGIFSFQGRGVSTSGVLRMVVVWSGIFVVVALAFTWWGGS